MSALFGLFNLNKKPVEPEILNRMAEVLSHRGPDGTNLWKGGAVGMGHHMMFTTPESINELLPMSNRQNNLTITADARVDNRTELFSRLGISAAERRCISDSALILKSYEKWGEQCPENIVGDFCFAIWDSKRRHLFCARDPIGMMSFFYYASREFFVFSTEIKGILIHPQVSIKLNETLLGDFLLNIRAERHLSFYEPILRLPPGHRLIVKPGGIILNCYWDWEPSGEIRLESNEAYAEAFRELFGEAVRCRLRSAYPVGIELSGGLDSAAIATLAARRLKEEGKCLIAVSGVLPKDYQGPDTDERNFIEAVCQQESNVDTSYVYPKEKKINLYDDLERYFEIFNAPIGGMFGYYTRLLRREARSKGVRVLLNGAGGDQVASSQAYGYLAELAARGKWRLLCREIRAYSSIYKKSFLGIFKNEVLKLLFPSFFNKITWQIKTKTIYPHLKNSPIHPNFYHQLQIEDRIHNLGINHCCPVLPNHRQNLLNILRRGITWGAEGDSYSVIDGLESRRPMLDRRLLEFCLSIPSGQFFQDGWKRSLIRRVMNDVVPAKILCRTTCHSFPPDFRTRFKECRPQLLQQISRISPNDLVRRYVDVDKLNHLLSIASDSTKGKDYSQYTIDKGIAVIRFLKWFEKSVESVL